MAKKTTTTRPKNEPEADAAAALTPAKPSARTRAPKTTADKKVAAGSRKSTSVSMASEPSEDDVRLRAYHRYLERGGGHGMDFEDWQEAKRELRELNGKK